MPFLDDLDLIVLKRELEQSDNLIIHESSGDRTASHAWKLVLDKTNVLEI